MQVLAEKVRFYCYLDSMGIDILAAINDLLGDRYDVAHKVSHRLAEDYAMVFFEDLRIRNMVKNHCLASAILDATWGKLRRLTAYKAERPGGRVIVVEPSGTSQVCSGCGETVPEGSVHENPQMPLLWLGLGAAAKNILARGLERARGDGASACSGCPDKQVPSRRREAHILQEWVVHSPPVSTCLNLGQIHNLYIQSTFLGE